MLTDLVFNLISNTRGKRRHIMSGHGGVGPSSDPVLNCATLSGSTRLNSPQKNVIEKLVIGTKLDLVLTEMIVEAHFNGEIAGTITWTNLARMIECIEDGYEYVAHVRSIEGGAIQVDIRPI